MDTNQVRERLLAREKELVELLGRSQSDGRNAGIAEVEDEIDRVSVTEDKARAFRESSLEFETLTLVRKALQRLDEGTYGTCLDCGKTIPDARLEAVPWAEYCVEDQARHEAEKSESELRAGAAEL